MDNNGKISAVNSGCEKLINLLSQVKPTVDHVSLIKLFDAIAKCLIGEVRIKKGDKLYDILEIEFYYFSPLFHAKDKASKVTYPRNAKSGEWYFHAYGLDLCFESNLKTEKPYYGGILIRSIRESSSAEIKPILGSGKVCDTLFSVYNAFGNLDYDENMPQIIDKDVVMCNKDVASTLRYHIADKELGIEDKLRFVVSDFEKTYLPMDNKKAWTTYFDKRRLGNSRRVAEMEIKGNY